MVRQGRLEPERPGTVQEPSVLEINKVEVGPIVFHTLDLGVCLCVVEIQVNQLKISLVDVLDQNSRVEPTREIPLRNQQDVVQRSEEDLRALVGANPRNHTHRIDPRITDLRKSISDNFVRVQPLEGYRITVSSRDVQGRSKAVPLPISFIHVVFNGSDYLILVVDDLDIQMDGRTQIDFPLKLVISSRDIHIRSTTNIPRSSPVLEVVVQDRPVT